MRRTGLIWWFAAFILAIAAGALTYTTLTRTNPSFGGGATGETKPVVVAVRDIPLRQSILKEDVIVKQFEPHLAPPDAAASIDQVIGKMATSNIYEGEPLLLPQLVTPNIVTQQLALSVPEGKVVVAVPLNSILIANRLVQPGDRVDILATVYVNVNTESGLRNEPSTVLALQGEEVHAIILPGLGSSDKDKTDKNEAPTVGSGGSFSSATASQSILFALDVQDALLVRHILDAGGNLDIALRAPEDDSLQDTIPVDEQFLIDRYQIDTNR
ncbi:MAG: Flp pilus assembly protein CpaB [Chloroflexi bacterium]|nr:Flp pilus assembly protein CpaB [Chloroflexota bacterium]